MSQPGTSSNAVSSTPQLSLEFLIKLIPGEFDGNRNKLRSFIKQIDAVFKLASPSQYQPLLLYVKSRITGPAREQIDVHCELDTWAEISELLIQLYQDKKSLDQLLQELNCIKQEPNENISEFYQRLEELSSRALGAVHATDSDRAALKGRLVMVNEITLNRFTYHTHPQISQMLRYRDFKTINNAFTAALAEEKALQLTYHNNIKCRICGRTNHTSRNCYRTNTNPPINSRPVHITNTNLNHHHNDTPVKQCRYCKNFGHEIEECRKRQYNNAKRQGATAYQTQSREQNRNTHQNDTNFPNARQPSVPPITAEEATANFNNLNA